MILFCFCNKMFSYMTTVEILCVYDDWITSFNVRFVCNIWVSACIKTKWLSFENRSVIDEWLVYCIFIQKSLRNIWQLVIQDIFTIKTNNKHRLQLWSRIFLHNKDFQKMPTNIYKHLMTHCGNIISGCIGLNAFMSILFFEFVFRFINV
jgi:hypothetical protein